MNGKTLVFLTVMFLIVGNLIGAGILALPVNTGLAGMLPSLLGMALFGTAMFFSALVLGREAITSRSDNFNYPSLYAKHLGKAGKWVAILANMIILYGLLVAYLSGGAEIIVSIFHISPSLKIPILLVLFFLITSLALTKSDVILRYNAIITLLLLASFALMIVIGERHIVPSRYTFTDWKYLPMTAPIIITAFHFHNIIPSICEKMKWNYRMFVGAVAAGMLLGYFMNAMWIQIGIGVLPIDESPNGLLTAFQQNLPATVPMTRVISSRSFLICALLFPLLAIVTSYIANGLGLLAFSKDLLVNQFSLKRSYVSALLAFAPPLAISVIWPDIFLKAINIVGGIGIMTLFGILPSIIYLKQAKAISKKVLGLLMLVLFSICLLVEIGQETGMLRLQPEMEYSEPLKKIVHKK